MLSKLLKSVLWVAIIGGMMFLCGCSGGQSEEPKVADLEFTVVPDSDLSDVIKAAIEERKSSPFHLTYKEGDNMFMIVGYGQQQGSGYSISVNEAYLTENTICLETSLIGPSTESQTNGTTSFPYIVVKTESREATVIYK